MLRRCRRVCDLLCEEITAAFAAREKALEHDLDHKPMDVHMTVDLSYNFLSK